MTNRFNNRVYGCAIIRSIDSNFNADFTHAPRTLPDGTIYATDKALKYAIKNYIKNNHSQFVLYMKRLSEGGIIFTLGGAYQEFKNKYPKEFLDEFPTPANNKEKDVVQGKNRIIGTFNLLRFIDVRLFGATFAVQKKENIKAENISIHGPVQINHAKNKFTSGDCYTEDILSPFRTMKEKSSQENTDSDAEENKDSAKENQSSTIGNQTNLQEGHYVYHFSINPKNLEDYYRLIENNESASEHPQSPSFLSTEDIEIFKESMTKAVTYLDSSRKIGSENEMALFVTLKEGSTKVLPGFTELIDVKRDKDKKVVIDATKVGEVLSAIESEIEKIELYYNPVDTIIEGLDSLKIESYNLLNSQSM
jgi:CRISPR-associated protein Csh2